MFSLPVYTAQLVPCLQETGETLAAKKKKRFFFLLVQTPMQMYCDQSENSVNEI